MESYKAKKALTQGLIHLFLIVFTITMLVPFLWMVLTAFKTQSESTAIDPFVILPSTWHFDNFVTVWNSYNFLLLYKNTLLMIFFRVLCAVLTATMAGYAFGRLEFPGKKFLFALVLIQMMVPGQIFIIPQYIMVSKLKWINTIAGLVFPGAVTAFGTFLLKQGYQGLPKDLEEAASIDGCNRWQIFQKVIFPLLKPIQATIIILVGVQTFNDFTNPLYFLPGAANTTVQLTLYNYKGQLGNSYNLLFADIIIITVPMLILFLFFNKRIVAGMVAGAVKG